MTNWKDGPLPPNTWNWGGVVLTSMSPTGFCFADFCGDHVIVDGKRYEANEVSMYNNCLDLPPSGTKRLSSPGDQ